MAAIKGSIWIFSLDRGKRHRGQSLVETALVLPLLLLVFMGIVQFGLILFSEASTSWAIRECARQISVGKTVVQAVTDNEDKVPSFVEPVSGTKRLTAVVAGGNVTVTVNARITIFVPLLNFVFPDGRYNLQNHTVMRME